MRLLKNIQEWKRVFKQHIKLDIKNRLQIEFADELYLPDIWEYYTHTDCTNCHYYFLPISDTSFFVVMHHSGVIGDYLFYFNKTIKKSWCMRNPTLTNVIFKRINSTVAYFTVTFLNNPDEEDVNRYIFVNTKSGQISDTVLNLHTGTLQLDSVNKNGAYFNFLCNDGLKGNAAFNYSKNKLTCSDSDCASVDKTYYRYIKSIRTIN